MLLMMMAKCLFILLFLDTSPQQPTVRSKKTDSQTRKCDKNKIAEIFAAAVFRLLQQQANETNSFQFYIIDWGTSTVNLKIVKSMQLTLNSHDTFPTTTFDWIPYFFIIFTIH